MYLLNKSPVLLTDMYEFTMSQVYFEKNMTADAAFELTIRSLPPNWGFFISAGHREFESFLKKFYFTDDDLTFLASLDKFSPAFLDYLRTLKPDIHIRALPEGTAFFPNEPVFEIFGPIIPAQLLESYVLNILGFSIIETSLAARYSIAAGPATLMEFGLRRAQGPISALRAAHASKLAGFSGTSNVFAARELDFPPMGTMAHSFVQAHLSEEQAFRDFASAFGSAAVLLIDTYDSIRGLKTAAQVAKDLFESTGTKLAGVRLDSGNIAEIAAFARDYFDNNGVSFLKIFVSGGLDEFKVADLISSGAPIDGFGVGTSFTVSHFAPDVDITYKLVQYDGRDVFKKSPRKETFPGRKKLLRLSDQSSKK